MSFEIIEIVKRLDTAFSTRTLTQHQAERGVVTLPYGNVNAMLSFDLGTSRKILSSKSFAGLNYFKPGMERLQESGQDLSILNNFYDWVVLFQEGEAHRIQKSEFSRLLKPLTADLENAKPRILRYFKKRKARIHSPLDYSLAIVRLCASLMIARLTSRPLITIFKALALRRNVFLAYFQPPRHIATNQALARLYQKEPPPEVDSPEWINHLLAQSLIVMGIDPLIGTICASIVDGQIEPMTTGVYRYCTTSFVSRICTAPVHVDGIDYAVGDICFISLLSSGEEVAAPMEKPQSASLAFGTGVHMCIGKQLALKILDIAEEVLREVFNEKFPRQCELAPDGTFLAFRNVDGCA